MDQQRAIPNWFYVSLIPGVGWLSLFIAGYRAKERSWMLSALTYGLLSLLGGIFDPLGFLLAIGWFAGMLHLGLVKDQYLTQIKLLQPGAMIQTRQEIQVARNLGIKVDINQATQHELVYKLNLPITQANRILELRRSGVVFTSVDELASYTGIPQNKLQKIASLMTFGFYEFAEGFERWQKVNTLTPEAIAQEFSLDLDLAQRIVGERDARGVFSSLIQLRQRVALPYDQLGKLI